MPLLLKDLTSRAHYNEYCFWQMSSIWLSRYWLPYGIGESCYPYNSTQGLRVAYSILLTRLTLPNQFGAMNNKLQIADDKVVAGRKEIEMSSWHREDSNLHGVSADCRNRSAMRAFIMNIWNTAIKNLKIYAYIHICGGVMWWNILFLSFKIGGTHYSCLNTFCTKNSKQIYR